MRAVLNRVLGLCGISKTTNTADDTGGVQKLQVQILGSGVTPELRDPLPSAQQYGFASSPVPGASHVVIFLGGDRTKGIAVASNDPRYRPTGMKPGEAMVHDNIGNQVYLSQSGLDITGATSITLTAGGHTLSISAAGVVIDGIVFGTHTHGNGNDGANTTAPIAGS